jgi:serine/threonine protein phosphatase 1
MIFQIFKKRKTVSVGNASVPDGMRIYAIGDIHGRIDLLQQLQQLIVEDAATLEPCVDKVVVYLGDYVDRGMNSKGVIDVLINSPLNGFESTHLKGNHEEQFLEFLENPDIGNGWMKIGGNATIHSYGVNIPSSLSRDDFDHLQADFINALPKSHIDFLNKLELTREIGDYLFVHAGINPYEPLQNQTSEDFLWIRGEFLEAEIEYGVVVVHGHSYTGEPAVKNNRICVDTGAYASNKLTCVVLEDTSHRFLST